jgi:hypothetical protein
MLRAGDLIPSINELEENQLESLVFPIVGFGTLCRLRDEQAKVLLSASLLIPL